MLSTVIPIFPLPNVVLFPGVFLPLHVFEPRYREMVRDTLSGDRLIGIVLLKPGWERNADGRPDVYQTGCAGLISHVESLDDGCYDLVLRGVEKFRVMREEEPPRAYRRAAVDYLDERVSAADAAAVRHRRPHLERLLGAGSDVPDHRFPSNLSEEEVINALSQYLDFEPVERQALLEQPGVAPRCNALIDLLEMKQLADGLTDGRGLVH
jgi:uncharacterized protein